MGRRLGQHFLFDPRILDRIVDALDPAPSDDVVEIGPGRGTLTRRLAARVGRVVAIEKDPALAAWLGRSATGSENGEQAGLPANVRIVEGDALTTDWWGVLHGGSVPRSPITVVSFKVIGNIPYQITTPLIERALTPPEPATTVFLVQKEVAQRVTAAPGSKSYGALSAGVQAVARVERLFTVQAGSFRPAPKVDSAVLRFRPLERPLVEVVERQAWRAFLARMFSQRRKQLGRALRDVAGWERDQARGTLLELGIDPAARPEVLSPPRLVGLFRAVSR